MSRPEGLSTPTFARISSSGSVDTPRFGCRERLASTMPLLFFGAAIGAALALANPPAGGSILLLHVPHGPPAGKPARNAAGPIVASLLVHGVGSRPQYSVQLVAERGLVLPAGAAVARERSICCHAGGWCAVAWVSTSDREDAAAAAAAGGARRGDALINRTGGGGESESDIVLAASSSDLRVWSAPAVLLSPAAAAAAVDTAATAATANVAVAAAAPLAATPLLKRVRMRAPSLSCDAEPTSGGLFWRLLLNTVAQLTGGGGGREGSGGASSREEGGRWLSLVVEAYLDAPVRMRSSSRALATNGPAGNGLAGKVPAGKGKAGEGKAGNGAAGNGVGEAAGAAGNTGASAGGDVDVGMGMGAGGAAAGVCEVPLGLLYASSLLPSPQPRQPASAAEALATAAAAAVRAVEAHAVAVAVAITDPQPHTGASPPCESPILTALPPMPPLPPLSNRSADPAPAAASAVPRAALLLLCLGGNSAAPRSLRASVCRQPDAARQLHAGAGGAEFTPLRIHVVGWPSGGRCVSRLVSANWGQRGVLEVLYTPGTLLPAGWAAANGSAARGSQRAMRRLAASLRRGRKLGTPAPPCVPPPPPPPPLVGGARVCVSLAGWRLGLLRCTVDGQTALRCEEVPIERSSQAGSALHAPHLAVSVDPPLLRALLGELAPPPPTIGLRHAHAARRRGSPHARAFYLGHNTYQSRGRRGPSKR